MANHDEPGVQARGGRRGRDRLVVVMGQVCSAIPNPNPNPNPNSNPNPHPYPYPYPYPFPNPKPLPGVQFPPPRGSVVVQGHAAGHPSQGGCSVVITPMLHVIQAKAETRQLFDPDHHPHPHPHPNPKPTLTRWRSGSSSIASSVPVLRPQPRRTSPQPRRTSPRPRRTSSVAARRTAAAPR